MYQKERVSSTYLLSQLLLSLCSLSVQSGLEILVPGLKICIPSYQVSENTLQILLKSQVTPELTPN